MVCGSALEEGKERKKEKHSFTVLLSFGIYLELSLMKLMKRMKREKKKKRNELFS